MDKQTLSNYGWIVICILVLSVMIALATPFGGFIANGVKSTTQGLFDVSQKAFNNVGFGQLPDQEFEGHYTGNGTDGSVSAVPGVIFADGTTLTWEELKLAENGTKYEYKTSAITDTNLGKQAFMGCDLLESINLPESLTSIGTFAFRGCTSLKSIYIPNGVTSIGDSAFYNCSLITIIDLSRCTNLTNLGKSVFSNCDYLTSIDLPDNITSIGNNAFYGCVSLESIDLPNNITGIGNNAFSVCTSLESINLPESLTSIGEYAFNDCASLKSINYAGSMEDWGDITLGTNWKLNVPATVVHCSDGDVSI